MLLVNLIFRKKKLIQELLYLVATRLLGLLSFDPCHTIHQQVLQQALTQVVGL